jgi:hypothetical protein
MRRRPAHRGPRNRAREFEGLLDPEAVFSDPVEILASPALGTDEKRAILARWLSRICAAEAALRLERVSAPHRGVQFDDVMDALRALERGAPGPTPAAGGMGAMPAAHRGPQKPVGTMH